MRILAATMACWLCACPVAGAQDGSTLPLIAMLRVNTAETTEPGTTLFRNALAAVGLVDGRNIRLESRLADGHAERLPGLARSLVGEHPKIIVPFGEAATRAAGQATSTIPILTISDDLVASGLIASLAKPGGNITGVSILATELDAKKIDLLKQLLPAARRFAILRDPTTSVPARMRAIGDAAKALGIELQIVDVHRPADIAPAFAAFRAAQADAVDILASPLLFSLRGQIGELSIAARLPAICQFREAAAAGCLASYGIDLGKAFVILAGLIDKVMKGANPGDIPTEQPSTFELVVNLKSAQALSVVVPRSILTLANEVIE